MAGIDDSTRVGGGIEAFCWRLDEVSQLSISFTRQDRLRGSSEVWGGVAEHSVVWLSTLWGG